MAKAECFAQLVKLKFNAGLKLPYGSQHKAQTHPRQIQQPKRK
jgi:hypothetical protein